MGRRRYRSAPIYFLVPIGASQQFVEQGEKTMEKKKRGRPPTHTVKLPPGPPGGKGNHKNRPKNREPYKRCLKLTLKQRLLINEYFKNGWKKEAAMRSAGYNHLNTWTTFSQPAIKREIERRVARMEKEYELNEEWVIKHFMRIAKANHGDILMKLQDNDYDLSVLTSDERYAIEELSDEMETVGRGIGAIQVRKTKFRLKSNLQALNSLARKLGMFNDKVTVTGEISLVDRIQAGRKRALDVEFEEVKEIGGPDG